MQIILTEEEYNALKSKSNIAIQVGEGIVDYQRRFRLALGNELLDIGRRSCGLSVGDIKGALDRAEQTAKRIQ